MSWCRVLLHCVCMQCSLRGLQPIQEVRLSSGVVWDAAAAAGPPAAEGAGVIVQLQREVERLQVETNLQGWLQ